jgi:hypothetical protein
MGVIRYESRSEQEVNRQGENRWGHGVNNKGERNEKPKKGIHSQVWECNIRGTNPELFEAGGCSAGDEMRTKRRDLDGNNGVLAGYPLV